MHSNVKAATRSLPTSLLILLVGGCYHGTGFEPSSTTTTNDTGASAEGGGVTTGAGGGSCAVDSDCASGWVCVAKECVDPSRDDGVLNDEMPGPEPALPVTCDNGAKDYADKTSADFCPISLLVMVDTHKGQPAMTDEDVADDIAFVNEYFEKSALSFKVIEIRHYDHDYVVPECKEGEVCHHELEDDDIEAARAENHIVLAYTHPELTTVAGRAYMGGYTKQPAAFVDAISRGATTVHELGHSLGLWHTFHPYKSPEGEDEPDLTKIPALGSDGYKTGDFISDTPIDPGRDFCKSDGCKGKCDEVCECEEFEGYTPDVRLAMSYYSSKCRTPETAFTPEQINRMRCAADLYLKTTWSCGDCTPGASTQCSGGDVYYFDSCDEIGGLAQDCDDDNPCTEDDCSGAQCTHAPVTNGTSCGDGLVCKGGSCVGEDVQQCDNGACCVDGVFRPASYVCEVAADSELGCPWGTDAGDDVGERTRDRLCSGSSSGCDGAYGPWSGWSTHESCSSGQACDPDSGTCVSTCGFADYFSPTLDSQTDSSGQQSAQTIAVSVTMEVQATGLGLEFRVCKGQGTFDNDVKVAITDAASSNAGTIVNKLTTAGKSCSTWTPIPGNYNSYAEGEYFGGKWNLVSPWTSAGEWPTYDCSVQGDPSGTCWGGIDISLKRTCYGL